MLKYSKEEMCDLERLMECAKKHIKIYVFEEDKTYY
jgi:hypothetical protein